MATKKMKSLPASGYHRIPLTLIDESPTNPRKTFDAAELQELADSIRVHGVHQPAIVRLRSTRYELVCGARRLRASKIAGQSDIPAIVRDVDDAAALELQLEENNQRRDVTDVEEAEAIVMLHETFGRSVADVAAHLGRSVPFVRSRIELGRAAPAVKQLLQDGLVRVGGALMLARAPVDAIDGIAERVRQEAKYVGTVRERELGRFVGEFARLLSAAPFEVDDGTLTGRGSCLKCPDRTGAQFAMFEGCSDAADRCLDSSCWDRKVDANWSRTRKDATKRGLKVLVEPWERTNADHVEADASAWRIGSEKKFRELVAAEALVVGRDETGRVLELVVLEEARASLAARDLAEGGNDSERDEQDESDEADGQNPDWYVKGRQRRWNQAREREATVRRIEAIGERELLIWLLGKVQYPVDVAFGRKRLALLEVDGNSIAKLTAWAETASTNEILAALVEDAWISGCLDDETTLDGLIEASAAPEEAAQ